jgi:phosphate transport system protein
MRDAYHDQLDRLGGRLPGMTRLVAEAMDRAGFALSGTDVELAAEVIADGARLSRACQEAEEQVYAISALPPPVDTDLRVVLATAHAVGELDRMGRLAVHVAEAVRRRYPEPVVPAVLTPRFVEMGRIAVWLAVMAGKVIETRDATLARTLVSVDDDMDDLLRTLFTGDRLPGLGKRPGHRGRRRPAQPVLRTLRRPRRVARPPGDVRRLARVSAR